MKSTHQLVFLTASMILLGLSRIASAPCAETKSANASKPVKSTIPGNSAALRLGETPAERDARLKWWREARFGMFIHWGPVSLKETEISWSRANSNPACPNNGAIPVAVYDNLYKEFNPVKFDARQWVSLAKTAGMKYMVLTAKHCDGFLLWDSKVSDYNIMHTPFKRDVCAELAHAAREQGIKIGWYFSPMDWRDLDCRSARNAEFVKRMQGEIAELLTNYGKIDLLWFDYDGRSAPWDQERTYALVKRLQPQIIIDNRLDLGGGQDAGSPQSISPHADYCTPEQWIGGFDTQHPWESCMTISRRGQWAWGGHSDGVKTYEECMGMLIRCSGGDGNVLLYVGPIPNGEIALEQANRLKEMGTWLAKYGESIYGCRGGPYKPAGNICCTCKGNVVYLHVLKWSGDTLALVALPKKIRSASLFGGGEVKMAQEGDQLTFTVAKKDQQPFDTIIRLELDAPAHDVRPLSARLPSLSLGKKATASNVWQNDPAFGADKAVDGDPNTRWAADSGIRQAWLEVDLGRPTKFTSAWLDEVYDRIRSFELQYKDGQEWKTFHKGTTVGAQYATPKFPPVTTRYVRLNVLDATNGPTITEFELR
ncbi:MAG: alpha-L-fucosidase [Thermoguttaceae bacterium]